MFRASKKFIEIGLKNSKCPRCFSSVKIKIPILNSILIVGFKINKLIGLNKSPKIMKNPHRSRYCNCMGMACALWSFVDGQGLRSGIIVLFLLPHPPTGVAPPPTTPFRGM